MTLVEPLRPAPEPLAACARFTGLPHLVFLDSSARGPLGRYSFLTADPVAVIQARAPDPLIAARELLAPHRRPPIAGLPPFQGGIAGYLSYEWGAGLEGVGAGGEVSLGLYDWVIAWDHLENRAWVMAWTPGRLAFVRERLAAPPGASFPPPVRPSAVVSNFTPAEYAAAVSRIRDYIAAGDVYQVNLAQRFTGPYAGSAFALYRRLRARNPAPFGAYLDVGDLAVASISPERLLQLDPAAGRVEARPIKG
ncbi:MAG: chorismate-binding protein, partial [Gemmatimonadales bacterium]